MAQDLLVEEWKRVLKCEYKRSWRAANSERVKETKRRWFAANPEKREVDHRWHEANREGKREYMRRWRAENLDAIKNQHHRRRVSKAKATGSFTTEQFNALCKHFNQRCLTCGEARSLTADHVIPLSWSQRPEYKDVALGDIDNIQPLCGSCNSSKQDSMVDYRTQPHRNCVVRS